MYMWGRVSRERMNGVHRELLLVADALLIEAWNQGMCDFTIPLYGGRRTMEEQQYLVGKGVSKTLQSRHLTGDALDVVPFINGRPSWDMRDPLTERAYQWKWRVWKDIAREYGFVFRRRISWDWPHHERRP